MNARKGIDRRVGRRLRLGMDADSLRARIAELLNGSLLDQGTIREQVAQPDLVAVLAEVGSTPGQPRVQREALRALLSLRVPVLVLGRILGALSDPDDGVVEGVLQVLDTHRCEARLHKDALVAVEETAANQRRGLTVRCRAIALLGVLGEVDVFERVWMLPANEPAIVAAVQTLVAGLLARRRNPASLRPENFERLVLRILQARGYSNVEHVGGNSDHGADLTCTGPLPRGRVGPIVVQCKRYREEAVDSREVDDLQMAISYHEARHGILVTTSRFTERAVAAAQRHGAMDLVDRSALQGWLDEAFGSNIYRIE